MLGENQFFSKQLYELRKKKGTLEEENDVMLAEIMTLDYLSVALWSFSAERGLEIQLLSNERDNLCKARNGLVQEITEISRKVEVLEHENKHLKVSFANLEECKRFLIRLDNDLKMARNVLNICEQQNPQTHTGKNPLLEKYVDLSEEKKNSKRSRVTNSELHRDLVDLKMDTDEAEVVKEEMGKKISTLSVDYDCKRNELPCPHQPNEIMKLETERMKKDIDKLRIKEDNITTELQKTKDEIKSSEVETSSLLNKIQCATISATLFKEKVIELILTCESIQRSAMLHRKVLHEELMLRDATVDELKEKANALEGENRRLKEELNAYFSLLGNFWDDIAILEEQTVSLGKYQPSPSNQGKRDNQVGHPRERSQELNQTYGARSPPGILELQSLQAKVRALQKQVRYTRSILELERIDSNASLEAAWKEIEALRSKDQSDNDSGKMKYERIMRDIKLDIVLNSSGCGNNFRCHGARRKGNANEISDQKLELWVTTEGDCSNNQKRESALTIEELSAMAHHHQFEEVEGNHPSSELVSEKELGVDKLEVPKKAESPQEWNKRVMERLCSDAQRLLVLQASIQELHKNMEAFGKINVVTADLDNVKVELEEAEGAISKLVDINSKLRKKAEDLSESSDHAGEKRDAGNRSRRQVSDRAEKASEKIGNLEFELQKLQSTLQKMEEERMNKKSRVAGKSGILLKEYIYGRRDSRKKKRGACGCTRPKANGD